MDYIPKTKPYDHQLEARAAARKSDGTPRPAFGFFMEMGTGKTKVAIDEFCEMYLDGQITLVIVFAPKGVYMNWPNRELPTHMPDALLKESDIGVWGVDTKAAEKQREKLFKKDGKLKIFFINTESMSSGQRAQTLIRRLQAEHPNNDVIVDESTFIKNPDSNRTDEIVAVGRRAKYRRIMTGSPVTRSPLDLYSQFDFLGASILGFGSFYSFRSRYAVIQKKPFGPFNPRTGRKRDVPIVVGYRDVEGLNKLIAPHTFRKLKEECLDLPPKIYEWRAVEMTEEQRRLYIEVRDRATVALGEPEPCQNCDGTGVVAALPEQGGDDFICAVCEGNKVVRGGDHVTASQVITQILRMHQILCGHATDETGIVHDVPSNRVKELLELLDETSGKGIIWCRYRRDIENVVAALRKKYGEKAVVSYYGDTNAADRETASTRFQGDSTCLWMVSNPQTGGYGNTWTAASIEVYFSNDYDLEKRMQSEDRAHRAGQTKSVTIVDLYVSGTVEEKIIKALRSKIDISSAIMGDGYREWLI